MKTKKFISIIASAVISASVYIAFEVSQAYSDDSLLYDNVEALANEEEPVLSNLHMYIWWVTEYYGGSAITCTLGGNAPCK